MTESREQSASRQPDDTASPASSPAMSLREAMSRELTPSERARLDELYRQAVERGRRQAEEGPGRIVLVVPLPRPAAHRGRVTKTPQPR
ncbi:MAG: hypothetical protein MUE82_03990 [Chloroflexi bacterium]|jgi:hypothetical protein|nr:hypothetical protein [Chloroflexota bacterium]